MVNRDMKICPTYFPDANHQGNENQAHSEISSHNRLSDYYEKEQITSVSEAVEKREHSCTIGGNSNLYSHCKKQYRVS